MEECLLYIQCSRLGIFENVRFHNRGLFLFLGNNWWDYSIIRNVGFLPLLIVAGILPVIVELDDLLHCLCFHVLMDDVEVFPVKINTRLKHGYFIRTPMFCSHQIYYGIKITIKALMEFWSCTISGSFSKRIKKITQSRDSIYWKLYEL